MNYNEDEQKKHKLFMETILNDIHKKELPLFLKGGTALMFGYGLDRFSEDIDLNSNKKLNLESLIKESARKLNINDFDIKLVKDSDTTKRYKIHYDNKMLKVEISFRDELREEELTEINNIKIYKVEKLIDMKLNALENRTKARDMHDIIFLFENYKNDFSQDQKERFRNFSNDIEKVFLFEEDYKNDSLSKEFFDKDLDKLDKLSKELNIERIDELEENRTKNKSDSKGLEL